MTKHKANEQTVMLILSCLGLLGLLAYTFIHTGSLLARYVHPWFFGYIAAFGVEAIIAGMSYRLATLKRNQKGNRFLVFVLVVALSVSALANIDEGHGVRYGEPLSLSNILNIDPIQAFIGLSATGLISLLVFAISEIIGSDVNTVAKMAERSRKQEEEVPAVELTPEPEPEQVDAGDYKQAVYAILKGGQQLGPRPMAAAVGCSPATAKKWIDSYQGEQANSLIIQPVDIPAAAGHRNGNGSQGAKV